jgi:hypothetical protein
MIITNFFLIDNGLLNPGGAATLIGSVRLESLFEIRASPRMAVKLVAHNRSRLAGAHADLTLQDDRIP